MNAFNDGSVAFLEDKDISKDGKLLINKPKVVVMVMGDFCGYCKTAAPMFREFANKHKGHVFSAAILLDGNDSEKALGKRISSLVSDFSGVPTFLLYINGKYMGTHKGERSVNALESFAGL